MDEHMLYDPVIPEGPTMALCVREADNRISTWLPTINRLIQTHLLISEMIGSPNLSPFMVKQYVDHMLKHVAHHDDQDHIMLDRLSSLKILQQTYRDHKTTLLESGCAIADLSQGHFFCLSPNPKPIHLHWHLEQKKQIQYWTYAHQSTKRSLSTLPQTTVAPKQNPFAHVASPQNTMDLSS